MEVALIGAIMALILASQEPAPQATAAPPAPVTEAPPLPTFEPKEIPPTTELVVVLPDANGRVGTVIVERGERRIVLNEAFATSRITADGEIRLEKLPEPEVRAVFERVVTALPPRPMSFQLYFIKGTDVLTEESLDVLERMLQELRKRIEPDIVVTGHTDRVGKDLANDQLSIQRADRVKADLKVHGIPEERIRVTGRGERDLLIPTEDGVDEPRNRRVEIIVR